MNLKAINEWTNKSFKKLLQLLKEMLPGENTPPNHNHETKNIHCPVGMEYKKIHACSNDCILYRKDFELLKNCSRCRLSIEEMEKHGPPMKVVCYLAIIPRMKRFFPNPNNAKNLNWHANERKSNEMYHHPTSYIQ